MSDPKTPREMAGEYVKVTSVKMYGQLQPRNLSVLEESIARRGYLAGIEAGARMAWDRIDDYLTGDMISFVRSFDEWWASLENK